MHKPQPSADSVFVAKSQKGYLAREALFDAAITLVAEKGINSVSIAELCTKAGIKRTSFYNYFQSIEELLDQLQIREDAKFDQELAEQFEDIELGIRRLALNVLKYFELAHSKDNWSLFVMEMFANHAPTAETMIKDVRCDVVVAKEAGDVKIADENIDAWVHLFVSSLVIANLQLRSGRLKRGMGREVVTLLLESAQTRPALIKQILESGLKG